MEIQQKLVEAIEDGKIVRVTELYAKQEGLPILRQSPSQNVQSVSFQDRKEKQRDFKMDVMDELKRTPTWKQKQVISELVENWQWQIRMERRKKGLSRTQLATIVGAPEEHIKMLEFGTLPSEDFILINKIQKTLRINLRKDGRDFNASLVDLMKQTTEQNQKSAWEKIREQKETEKFAGKDVEILDEEI